jgi:hypothetical protein
VKDFCFANRLCYKCFSQSHKAADCTGTWVNGDPPGYRA